jgi:hypothetical protein
MGPNQTPQVLNTDGCGPDEGHPVLVNLVDADADKGYQPPQPHAFKTSGPMGGRRLDHRSGGGSGMMISHAGIATARLQIADISMSEFYLHVRTFPSFS